MQDRDPFVVGGPKVQFSNVVGLPLERLAVLISQYKSTDRVNWTFAGGVDPMERAVIPESSRRKRLIGALLLVTARLSLFWVPCSWPSRPGSVRWRPIPPWPCHRLRSMAELYLSQEDLRDRPADRRLGGQHHKQRKMVAATSRPRAAVREQPFATRIPSPASASTWST